MRCGVFSLGGDWPAFLRFRGFLVGSFSERASERAPSLHLAAGDSGFSPKVTPLRFPVKDLPAAGRAGRDQARPCPRTLAI